MKELSLHLLDIVQNSIKAGATKIDIEIIEDTVEDLFSFSVKDNGCGMSEEFVNKVRNPFTTTRTTRKVGLGIPLLEAAALQCDGGLDIESEPGVGTTLTVRFRYSHIDRAPLGDVTETMTTLISGSPDIDFVYRHSINGNAFVFKTEDCRQILQEVPLNTPDVLMWIEGTLQEGIQDIQVK